MQTAKTLITLDRCPGWPESSLGTKVILFVLSWDGSIIFVILYYSAMSRRLTFLIDVSSSKFYLYKCFFGRIWWEQGHLSHDMTWQNQQNECASSEDSDQPRHLPSLLRVFAVRSMGSWGPKVSSCGQKRLIRLSGCPGWSESLLGAHSFCWFYHVAAHLSSFEPSH